MGKIFLNGVDYSASSISEVTGIKGNAENTYRKGNVNITPEDIGALATNGNAVSATKAIQDGDGNNIVDTYVKKTDSLTGDYLPLSGGKMNKSSQVLFSGNTGIDTSIGMNGSKFISYYHPEYIDFRNGNTGHEFDVAELRSNYLQLDSANGIYSTVRANGITVHGENTECIVKSDGVYVDGTKVGSIANSVKDPRSGSSNTLSYDGTIANPTYIAAWNDRTIEKYPMSSLDSKYAKATHTHDDRYYTETEIDNKLKALAIPSGLGNIITGQFNMTYSKNGNDIIHDFFLSDSTFKRSACVITSLYMNAANSKDQYVSVYRQIAIHQFEHGDAKDRMYQKMNTKELYSYNSTNQNVAIEGKQTWMGMIDYSTGGDGTLHVAFDMPSITAAAFTSGVIYCSWAVIM